MSDSSQWCHQKEFREEFIEKEIPMTVISDADDLIGLD